MATTAVDVLLQRLMKRVCFQQISDPGNKAFFEQWQSEIKKKWLNNTSAIEGVRSWLGKSIQFDILYEYSDYKDDASTNVEVSQFSVRNYSEKEGVGVKKYYEATRQTGVQHSVDKSDTVGVEIGLSHETRGSVGVEGIAEISAALTASIKSSYSGTFAEGQRTFSDWTSRESTTIEFNVDPWEELDLVFTRWGLKGRAKFIATVTATLKDGIASEILRCNAALLNNPHVDMVLDWDDLSETDRQFIFEGSLATEGPNGEPTLTGETEAQIKNRRTIPETERTAKETPLAIMSKNGPQDCASLK